MAESQPLAGEKTQAKPAKSPQNEQKPKQLPLYNVVLLDDDDHSYDYVVDMLESLFAHPHLKAYRMAKTVDTTGRVIVCTTHKERAELKRDQILGYGCDFRIASCAGSMSAVIEPVSDE
jgi:ATP-dependent Clp protease adaptor protein ClpS